MPLSCMEVVCGNGLMLLRYCIGIVSTFNEYAVSLTIDILGWVNQNQIERTNCLPHHDRPVDSSCDGSSNCVSDLPIDVFCFSDIPIAVE